MMTAISIFHASAHADNHPHRPGTDGCPACFSEDGDCASALPDSPLDAKICNQIGFHHYERGDYETAIGCFKKAINLSPRYPIPFNNLGVVYLKSRQLELAKDCFKKAIVANPEYVKAICNLAVVSYQLGDLQTAEKLLRQAGRINESYVRMRIGAYLEAHPGSYPRHPDILSTPSCH